jgi:hypothetical protein
MIKTLMIIAVIVVCHAMAFVGIYFGRIRGITVCSSDVILFVVPLIVAATAYVVVFLKMITLQRAWARRLSVALATLVASAISLEIGAVIAFNLWGT